MPDVIDVGLLDHVARRLHFDIGDPVQLADLAAVAVTRLAWRDGPLEDWHAVPYQRISNAEMMRANAATTRLVRDHLISGIAESTSSTVATADLLVSACGLVADQNRRLPDGRSVGSLAPDARQRDLFDDHVRAFADRCAQLVFGFGGREVLALLACHAATYCWRWWLAPAWPRRVTEFIRRLDNPSRWPDEYMANHVARLVTCAPV